MNATRRSPFDPIPGATEKATSLANAVSRSTVLACLRLRTTPTWTRFRPPFSPRVTWDSAGRPSITPGTYFRMLLLGYFEGIDSERGIAWRAADSLSYRKFLGYDLSKLTPDHSTVSRTRRLYSVETHRAVMKWVLKILRKHGLADAQSVCIDATTLQANAAMKSLVRRDTGQAYDDYLRQLAEAEGIENATKEQLARLDRKRKKKASNDDWTNPNDPSARITKMKDGRTKLAYKAEHAVDLASGALLAVTVQPADRGDTASYTETLDAAQQEA